LALRCFPDGKGRKRFPGPFALRKKAMPALKDSTVAVSTKKLAAARNAVERAFGLKCVLQ